MHKFILYLLLFNSYVFSITIDYKTALKLTLENNKQLQEQKLEIESSKLDVKKVQSFSYGKLELKHEASRTNHAGYVFNSKLSSREASFKDFGFSQMSQGLNTQPTDLNYPEDRNNFNTKMTYEIPLFTGFKLQTQEDMMKIAQKAQELKLTLDEKSLEFELLNAYNGAVVAKEFIKATQKAKEVATLFVESANAFYNEGLVTKIDKKQAQVHELNIKSRLTEAKNRFDIAIAYLKFLTSNENIDDVKDLEIIEIENKDLKNSINEAISNRDDLKILKEQEKSMKKNIELSNSSYYPSIYSYVEYGYNDNQMNFDSNKDYYMGLLGVKYTLFDDTRSVEKQKSQIALNKTVLGLNQLKDSIKLEVEKATLELKAKKRAFKEKKEAKELANEVLEQSKLMYKNQLIAMTELLKQEAIFRENEASFIMANYELSLALAKINLARGQSLKEDKN
ncbi:TolC family protein [Halarcobacter ebronensis]|uniref:Transporter n=1 Tax=Halarcobacter ebronensis TaxID=1462615 RepID=A0A4V1M0S4_9BACT|nr:TolC family protein [Halarcobacter ebronensis]QKF82272.1 RND family efflux system, outer membrane channel protein, TolC family [Halarcobacter ebronensis]RXK07695.1 transporter [Halarcobacter ebronensis]